MFDAQRFLRLARAHWAEHRRPYAWFFGIIIIVHFVLLLITLWNGHGFVALSKDGQGGFYYSGLFVTGPIFAARYFQQMSRRESALVVLMRPASLLEKWLLAFACVALLYPVAYTLVFYVCDIPAWLIARAQAHYALAHMAPDASEQILRQMYRPENYTLFCPLATASDRQGFPGIFLILTTLQAFGMLGTLYFKAMPFIKTVLTAFFVLVALMFVTGLYNARPDLLLQYWSHGDRLSTAQSVFFPAVWLIVPGLLWLSSFFALREREVA